MGDKTAIQWTEATWNPVVGCSIVSAGCTHCYAMGAAHRHQAQCAGLGRASKYDGTTTVVNGHPVWTGTVRLDEAALLLPLRWKRPRRIFVNSMSDLFHESLPDKAIDRVFAVMALSPHHTFQVLTKRAARMRSYLTTEGVEARIAREAFRLDSEGGAWINADMQIAGMKLLPLSGVWLGVSVEDQKTAESRIPELLDTPAAIRFISAEPLLGPLDLTHVVARLRYGSMVKDALTGIDYNHHGEIRPSSEPIRKLDWVIVGGESGPRARPMHAAWPRHLRDQCATAGVPFFFKQWGEWLYENQAGVGQMPGARFFNCDGGAIDPKPPEGPATGKLWHWWEPYHFASIRIGKHAAGRLLDGVEHNAMPAEKI